MKLHEYYVIPRLKERNEVVQVEEDTEKGAYENGEYRANKTEKVIYRSTIADCYAYIQLLEREQLKVKL